MLKSIFGFVGILVVLAVVLSLAKTQFGAISRIGETTTRVHSPSGTDDTAAGSSMAGRAVGEARLDGFAATAAIGAAPVTAQQQVQGAQKSVFGRTDDALQQSVDRYKHAEP